MTEPLDLAAGRHQGVGFAANAAGAIVSPYTAPREAAYFCLACHERVVLRRGQVRRPHFAHRADSQCAATGESIEHAAFKGLLAAGLRRHQSFTAQMKCPACGHDQTTTYPLTPQSEVFEELAVEGFRVDVGVKRDGQVVLAFEVFVTHAVGATKALTLKVPWLEVSANPAGVLQAHKRPTVRVIDTNLYRHRPCKVCGTQAGSNAEAAQLKLLAQEAAWREDEARRNAEQAEQRRADEARQFSHTAQTPHAWITAFTPQLAAYRAPLYVTVQGRRLLVHPSLLPSVIISETPAGRYIFQNHALRFLPASGAEQYASARLGFVLDHLLMGLLPATVQAEELLTQVRAVLAEEPRGTSLPRWPERSVE